MRRRTLLGGLGGLGSVGLGGCLRLDEGGGTRTAIEASTTDATTVSTTQRTTTNGDDAVESDEEAADVPDTYPTGMDEEGVYAYLVDNHVNTLVDTTFVENWTVANRTEGETRKAVTATVDDGRAVMERGIGVDLKVFYDSSGGYWREDLGDGATYGKDRRAFEVPWVTKSRELRQLFIAADWNAPTPVEGGFEIAAAGTTDVQSLKREYDAASIESFEADGFVTADGVVTDLTVSVEFVHEEEDRLFEMRTRHRVTDVGTASLAEPSWLSTARDRAPEVDVRIDDANEYVVFEHLGGNPIEPGTNVVLYDRSERGGSGNWGYRDNDEPFEAGETVYLWMEDGRLHWNHGGRPSGASPKALDRDLAFWMHRHGAEYFGNVEL